MHLNVILSGVDFPNVGGLFLKILTLLKNNTVNSQIEIFQSEDSQIQVQVRFEGDTVWLSQQQMALLFSQTKQNISLHINNCFKEGELEKDSTVKEYLTVQQEGTRKIRRKIEYYNLDIIISVGYRVKSKRGTQFRQWATQRLRDYLVQGYAINEKRLEQKQQEVEYLKTGIRILNRAIEEQADLEENEALKIFSSGLELLDDYDHEKLDSKGNTVSEVIYPSLEEYLEIIESMRSVFPTDVFARPKDQSFESAVGQIGQSFGGEELYRSLEEKAAMLLYLIVKNHCFVDGNKRIGAACFLHFLYKNGLLFDRDSQPVISNKALASLTLFVAVSKPEEMETVKRLIISILNRR
jgi:prophage maintenance system killer protein